MIIKEVSGVNIHSFGALLFFAVMAGMSLKIASEMIKTGSPIYFFTGLMLTGVYVIGVIIMVIIISGKSASEEKDAGGIKQ